MAIGDDGLKPASLYTKRWKATQSGMASVAKYEQSDKGRETHRRAKRAWKERNVEWRRNHERILARVRRAVRRGDITKTACACGESKVQAHHYLGYEPEHEMDVQWLCSRHHYEAHHPQGIDR